MTEKEKEKNVKWVISSPTRSTVTIRSYESTKITASL